MAREQTIVTGDLQVDKALRRFENNSRKKAVRRALRATTKKVQADSERLAAETEGEHSEGSPKRFKTRAMRRSRTKLGALVTTGDAAFKRPGERLAGGFHGQFVEFGTRKTESQPFMRPALYNNEQAIKREFIEQLRAEIRRAGVKLR